MAHATRTLLIGATGQLGNELARLLAGPSLVAASRDQVTAPTYTCDLAATVAALIERTVADPAVARGVVHATAAGQCSWHEFAGAIVTAAGLAVAVEAITTAALGAPAARPAYSILENGRLAALGIGRSAPWQDGPRRYLAERGELAPPR